MDTPPSLINEVANMRRVLNNEDFASRALRPETVDGLSEKKTSEPCIENPDNHMSGNQNEASETIKSDVQNSVAHQVVVPGPEASTAAKTEGGSTAPSEDGTSDAQFGPKPDFTPASDKDSDSDSEEYIGCVPETKHLYASKINPESDEIHYSEKLPIAGGLSYRLKRDKEAREGPKKFAILHYHKLLHGKLTTEFIEIQSAELKNVLGDILSEYPKVNLDAPKVQFKPPFMPFVHRWDRLLQAEKEASNEETKKLLTALRETLSTELEESFEASRNLAKTGYIDFSHLLVPFVPGDIILRSREKNGLLSAAILEKASIKKDYLGNKICKLELGVLSWNGKEFGFKSKTRIIDIFEGFTKIVDLPVFPLSFHPDKDSIRQKLIQRGRTFESLRGQHAKYYSGFVRVKGEEYYGPKRTVTVSERIIVDAESYYRFQDKSVRELKKIDRKSVSTHESKESQQPSGLTDEQCLVTSPRVKGFALKSKAWYMFDVDSITSISWNEKLLGNLVLQAEEKEMLLALIEENVDQEDGGFDDFFEGKGKGLTLLLAGPPGVGKTLTAESVAEELKRPLYRIGAGDLGIAAESVEKSLKKAFDQCAHWNAVLLIDEADVFLERRSSKRLDQNELVSVFLTTLEYFQGTLILTTNRTRGIDPAFESRIDIILSYDDLTQASRRQIWVNFINTLPPNSVDLSPSDLDSLSEWPMNGRQIKSAVKTARVIALKQKVPLGLSHLELVLNVRKRGSKLIDTEGWL